MPLVFPPKACALDGTPIRGMPRWFSGYRHAPWETVMQLACHMFLILLVEDFCVLGFPDTGMGTRWHPLGVAKMVCGLFSRPPVGTVMQLTCHMFLIHLVEDFCALGPPPEAWDQDGPPGGCRDGSRAIGQPPGAQ